MVPKKVKINSTIDGHGRGHFRIVESGNEIY